MENNNFITIKEVHNITGISIRNIKFWTEEYQIKLLKKGRNNYYSPKIVSILNLINFLSKTKFFTKNFIQILVEYNLNGFNSNQLYIKEYLKFINDFNELLENNELENIDFDILNHNYIPKKEKYELNITSKQNKQKTKIPKQNIKTKTKKLNKPKIIKNESIPNETVKIADDLL